MRTVAALFDAPIPARAAARALVAAGFNPGDIILVPALADATTHDAAAPEPAADLPPDDPGRLASGLVARGLPRADAQFFAEGVRRGAILLAAAAPTLSAPIAADIIAGTLPPDPADLAMAWAADPDLRYTWADVPAPMLIDQPKPRSSLDQPAPFG